MIRDPYCETERCVARLRNELATHGKLIVAMDFDDTLYDFHKIGCEHPRAVALLRRCSDLGFHMMLFTGTPPSQWPIQRDYLSGLGIRVDCVNENPFPLPFGNHGKPYYNILLDDRAGLGQALDILESTLERHFALDTALQY